MYPTNYFRWERRDSAAPTRVLQQWHCRRYSEAVRLILPQDCDGGEWRDVPTVMEPQEPPQWQPINPTA